MWLSPEISRSLMARSLAKGVVAVIVARCTLGHRARSRRPQRLVAPGGNHVPVPRPHGDALRLAVDARPRAVRRSPGGRGLDAPDLGAGALPRQARRPRGALQQ